MKTNKQHNNNAANPGAGANAQGGGTDNPDASAAREQQDAAQPQDDAAHAHQDAPQQEAKPAELDTLKDQLLRLRADFDNYRKRVARDQIETIKRANADLIEALLPALDHFGSAEAMMAQSASPETAPYVEGFRMVKAELMRVLASFDLEPIPALAQPFDANFHEALSTQVSESAEPGTVMFEIRKGYMLGGRVLRASQVIVAAEPAGTGAADASSDAGAGADESAEGEKE